jgi:hypothetical protein
VRTSKIYEVDECMKAAAYVVYKSKSQKKKYNSTVDFVEKICMIYFSARRKSSKHFHVIEINFEFYQNLD